jgi:hypothetical protein
LVLVFQLHWLKSSNFSPNAVEISRDSNLIDFVSLNTVPATDTLFKVAKEFIGNRAHLFLAIKIEESGNDKHYSWLSTTHFNLCGMRFPRNRKTYAIGKTNTNYAIYRNWFECLLDFKIYMEMIEKSYVEKFKKTPTDLQLIEFMSSRFNHFAKWKTDMLSILKTVKRKYQ